MMKFCALNESSLSDDDGDPELATREAQEVEAYLLYHQALKKQSDGNVEDAEKMFKEILEMEFLTQIQPSDEKEVPLRPALTLKYLLYKNLASISNGKKDFHAAVEFFLEALEIDATDVIMWYQMGKASLNIANYSLARLCFEEGLKCNPNHWPCLDNIITVMYTLNDYASCLYYISKALERECYYLKGLAFKDKIYKEDPSLKSFCESYFSKCDPSINFTEYDNEAAEKLIQEAMEMREKKRSFYKPVPLPILSLLQPIKESTWKSLGDSLINMYDVIYNTTPNISFSCRIDLSQYVDNANKNIDDKLTCPSPVSSLSEACSSNSTSRYNGLQATQKSDGLLQLAGGNNIIQNATNVNQTEMEIDEAPTTGSSNLLQNNSYPLVLPQIEIIPPELSIYNDTTSSTRRTSKRKRLLTELSEFSSKRRSTRVRNPAIKKPHDNVNYQELLQKFLPSKLIGDGKFEEQDEDSETVSLDKGSDLTFGQSSENDKSDKSSNSSDLVSTEKNDVTEFLANNQLNGGIIDLLYKYVVVLGSKSSLVWPKNVIDVFCLVFSRLRKHLTIPNIFSNSTDICRLKEMGLAILLYCEFKVDKWYLNTGHSMSLSPKGVTCNINFQYGSENVGNDFHSDTEFLVQLTVRKDALLEDWLNFSVRALWLKAKFHSLEGEVDLAVSCMGKLNDIFCEEEEIPPKISVLNCSISNTITADNVQQQLESLQRCQSLEEVQRLYEHKDYSAVVNLLILTFNQPRTKRKQNLDGVPERHAQLILLQNSLWNLERYKECVYWSEMSFNEALQQFMNAARSDWSETMALLLQGLDNCAKINSDYLGDLEESKLVRLTQNLILVIVIQMENYDFSADNASLLIVLPWIILYRLILNEENRKTKKSSSKNKPTENGSLESSNYKDSVNFLIDFDLSSKMPSSMMLLFTAHEYLGRRSWCTAADGLLLLHCIDVMMKELRGSGNSCLYREDLETGLEQCIYCLYGHPHKRTRAKHLQEHSSKQLTLTWERAAKIFQYFKPSVLPEFDSYRTSTVSAELESLLKRITAIVPPDEDPTTRVDNYTAYIEGATDKCPDPPFGNKKLSPLVKDLYYLLGDYYFKNKEFSKAIRLYLMDICINPDRQDSWAGMALSRSSQLDQKLNSYELRNESTIYRKSSAALRCFEHALRLDPTTSSLWIEHGSLAYILHAHASRQLKQDAVCDELGELLRKKKSEMLLCAKKCFKAANRVDDGGEPEEAWLHHYMLGKIAEKEGLGPPVYLDHYQKALMYLHEDFARYPQKIQYHNPAELSIEALEVYYRLHASCLKFLSKHEVNGTDLSTLKVIRRCLNAVKESPFAHYQEKCKKEMSSPSSESEEYIITPVAVEPKKNVDHTYFSETAENPKKSDILERRSNRPSTDSSPEAPETVCIKEVMDSLVGVVAERFVDEELENTGIQTGISKEIRSLKNGSTKIIVESIVEESVYTSSNLSVLKDNQDKDFDKNLKEINMKKAEIEREKAEREKEELAKMQALAMELETEAAASKLVEEMNLQSNEIDHYGYSGYHMFDQKQEDNDSAYYEPLSFDGEVRQDSDLQRSSNEKYPSSRDNNVAAVQSILDKTAVEPMIEETERAVQSLLDENERAVQSLFDRNETVSHALLTEEEIAVQSLISENERAVQSLMTENENVQSLMSENEMAVQTLYDIEEKKESVILPSEKKVVVESLASGNEKIVDSLPTESKNTALLQESNGDKVVQPIYTPEEKVAQLLISEKDKASQPTKSNGNSHSNQTPKLSSEGKKTSLLLQESAQLLNVKKDAEVLPVIESLLEKLVESKISENEKNMERIEPMDIESAIELNSCIDRTPGVSDVEMKEEKADKILTEENLKNTEIKLEQKSLKNKVDNGKASESNVVSEKETLLKSDPKPQESENKNSNTNNTGSETVKLVISNKNEQKTSKETIKSVAEATTRSEISKATEERGAGKIVKDTSNSKAHRKSEAGSRSNSRKKKSSAQPKPQPTPEELLQSKSEISKLILFCLESLREVLQRFIQHYKALYRMAHYYCYSTRNRNLQWAREILLAATPPSKRYPSMPGLFADRKNTNFFNGIWRAPSNEIDRPGSFGAHMYRSVHLLIQVLSQQKDYNMLVFLTQQLYRTPDLGKKYMRDTDRVVLVREAYDCCVNILRDQMNSLLQEEPPPEESRLICCLLEIYRSCQTLLKAGIYVDETNDLLVEAYTMYRIGEVDPYPSVLDQATKFCQLQLGKSYPQEGYRSNPSKYLSPSDMGETNTSILYSSDAWQKEIAKSLIMPVMPCEPRNKPELKSVQDPLILIPIDPKFNPMVQNTGVGQCSMVPPHMVHVEKPKAENLQACSMAFLPVAPVFSKEASSMSSTVPATSLLSCQAFECFDVLTTLMQASGYQVAHQSSTLPTNSASVPMNLQKSKSIGRGILQSTRNRTFSTQPKFVEKPKRRKRRTASQRVEGLNLCKRISTKPIVSSSIANSIAEIKVPTIITNPKIPTQELFKTVPLRNMRTSNQTSVISKTSDFTSERTVIVKSPASRQQSLQVSDNYLEDTVLDNSQPICLVKTYKTVKLSKEPINKVESNFVENNDDSSTSANQEASLIEKCAKEMLEYINQTIEDVLTSKYPDHCPSIDETLKLASEDISERFKMIPQNIEETSTLGLQKDTKNKDLRTSKTVDYKQTKGIAKEIFEGLKHKQDSSSLDTKGKTQATEMKKSFDIIFKDRNSEITKNVTSNKNEEETKDEFETKNNLKKLFSVESNGQSERDENNIIAKRVPESVVDDENSNTVENEDNSGTIENIVDFTASKTEIKENNDKLKRIEDTITGTIDIEENSDTMDVELKEELKIIIRKINDGQCDTEPEFRAEILNPDELSKDSSTQLTISLPQPEDFIKEHPKE